MKKRSVYILLGLAVPILAAAQAYTGKIVIDGVEYSNLNVVEGNGRHSEEYRDLPCFKHISVEAGVDVVYRPGKRCQARVEGDSNLLSLIQTQVQGDRLLIEVSRSIRSDGPLRVELRSPSLREISIRSAADAELLDLDAPELVIKVSGSGDVRAQGKAGALTVIAEGSGTLDLGRLRTKQARIKVTGAADVTVNASHLLQIDSFGAGDVLYYGKPARVITNISGAGDVEAAE